MNDPTIRPARADELPVVDDYANLLTCVVVRRARCRTDERFLYEAELACARIDEKPLTGPPLEATSLGGWCAPHVRRLLPQGRFYEADYYSVFSVVTR